MRKTGISYNFVLLFGCLQITLEPGGVKEDQPSVFNFTMSMVQSQRTVTERVRNLQEIAADFTAFSYPEMNEWQGNAKAVEKLVCVKPMFLVLLLEGQRNDLCLLYSSHISC